MKKERFGIYFILLLGAVLRFYSIGEIPVGFHRDEAFLGYNAFSLQKTGHDMAGQFLPLHLKSYLYSPGLYSYLAIPGIVAFGLSTFSTRLPSALFGLLSILILYHLVRSLLPEKKYESVPYISALLLSISPWHINLNRTTTENSVVVFFILSGMYLYIRWSGTRKAFYYILALFSFVTTLYLYQAPRVFLPLFIPVLMYTVHKIKGKIGVLHPLNVLLLGGIIFPVILVMLNPALSLRVRTVSLFASPEAQLVTDERIREDGISHVPLITTRIFHNKPLEYTNNFLLNYFNHYSYSFLFTDHGKPDRYRIPGMGLLYVFELPFLLTGMYYLLRTQRTLALLIFGWIFITPIGSALAHDDIPNLQRTLIMVPPLVLCTAFGLWWTITLLKRTKRFPVVGTLSFLYIFGLLYYIHSYYIHQIVHMPYYRQEGYKELVSVINQKLPDYTKAVITNRESAPAIFFLFFGKYDPATYQKETAIKEGLDFSLFNFSTYEFSTEECPYSEKADPLTNLASDSATPDILYVNYATCKIPDSANIIVRVKRSDNTDVFTVLERKP